MIARKVLLTYPDPNQPFHIETGAPDYQLGAVVKQHGVPVAFFNRELTSTQRNYTMMQKELLSIVEVLTTFRPILYGSDIHIWTDHDNLTYTKLSTQQVRCWHLSIKEYGPQFHYKRGVDNIEADTLSRYPLLEGENIDEQLFYEDFLLESFLNYPEDVGAFPLNFIDIAAAQLIDPVVQADDAPTFQDQDYHGTPLICRQSTHGWPMEDRHS
jgi:hypothetical protein